MARSQVPTRHKSGRDAEDAAAHWLDQNGFQILWRNLRIGSLEIDIVAQKADLIVIVEVRMRSSASWEKPLASISRTKRLFLLKAARGLWRGRLSKRADVARVRIDVASVTKDEAGLHVEWIAGALTEEG